LLSCFISFSFWLYFFFLSKNCGAVCNWWVRHCSNLNLIYRLTGDFARTWFTKRKYVLCANVPVQFIFLFTLRDLFCRGEYWTDSRPDLARFGFLGLLNLLLGLTSFYDTWIWYKFKHKISGLGLENLISLIK